MIRLLSISDIVSEYQVSRHTVWNWHRRDTNFPKPIQFVNTGKTPLFCQKEIQRFVKKYYNKGDHQNG
jgi:predicted DNA-binding transcriptional regulator AlpA